jgi:surface carbohydrate biosynthesis protein
MKKILIINVETKARDFNSRMMVAYQALTRGYKVVIGAQSEMSEFLKYLPKGIFFEKSIARNKLQKLLKIKKIGHKIVNLDEEGIASQNNKHFYLKQRMSKKTLDLTEYFFTWGNNEKELIESKYTEYKNKIKTTGNPRIELWKPEYAEFYKNEVAKINEKYNDFIFITSNFASIQHARGDNFLKNQDIAFNKIETKEDQDIFNAKKAFMAKVYIAFLNMVKTLSKSLPDRTIVIRPHPADNIDIWKENFKQCNNVFIEYEYSATPWIIASRCMVHSSCATGIEGFLMNKPVFSYLPYQDHDFVKYISNILSDVCNTEQQLLDKIIDVFNRNYNLSSNRELKTKENKHILDNIDSFESSKKILDYIDKINISYYRDIKKYKLAIFYVKNAFKYLIKKIIGRNTKADAYDQQKMPGITLKEVQTALDQFKVFDDQVKGKRFKINKIHNKNLFVISDQ